VGTGLVVRAIGTVQDGITTLARSPTEVQDRPDAIRALHARRLRFEAVTFRYGGRHK